MEYAVVAASPKRLCHVASELVLQSAAAREAATGALSSGSAASPGRGDRAHPAPSLLLSSAAAASSVDPVYLSGERLEQRPIEVNSDASEDGRSRVLEA